MKIDFRRHGNYGWQMQVNWGTLRFGVPAAQIVFITTESVEKSSLFWENIGDTGCMTS